MASSGKGRGDQPAAVLQGARRHLRAVAAAATGEDRSPAIRSAAPQARHIHARAPHARAIDVSGAHIVQVEGNFVGAAMRDPAGFRFVALDVRLDDLDGMVWPSFPELRWQVESIFRLGRWNEAALAPA